jgi:hypothetical protein
MFGWGDVRMGIREANLGAQLLLDVRGWSLGRIDTEALSLEFDPRLIVILLRSGM